MKQIHILWSNTAKPLACLSKETCEQEMCLKNLVNSDRDLTKVRIAGANYTDQSLVFALYFWD